MTASIENFVKAIYKQSVLYGADTKLSTIAGLLNITNAAATDMARKLADKKLVYYIKYKPLTLTQEGKEIALNVIRKHRLWETFLFTTLGLSLHEIHREAEVLEHPTSDFLADKIDNFLGNPAVDPHGDPIPSNNGKEKRDDSQLLLSEAKAGNLYEISRLYSSEKDFFDFCNINNIEIGSAIWIEKQYESRKMTEIKVSQNKILLNNEFTRVIYVKQINNL
jgi:DtxR family Mn-dependent transcriptional regulator